MSTPLYGIRQGPLRMALRSSIDLRRCSFPQHRVYVCVFSFPAAESHQEIGDLALLRADDFLAIAPPRCVAQFQRVGSFQDGPFGIFIAEFIAVFLGIQITVCPSFSELATSQYESTDRLEEAPPESLVVQNRATISRQDFLKVSRWALGSTIWPTRTQYYSSYLATRLATSLTRLPSDASGICETVTLIDKLVRPSLPPQPRVIASRFGIVDFPRFPMGYLDYDRPNCLVSLPTADSSRWAKTSPPSLSSPYQQSLYPSTVRYS